MPSKQLKRCEHACLRYIMADLEVVTSAASKLRFDWPDEQASCVHSKLDDRYLTAGLPRVEETLSLPSLGSVEKASTAI